MMLIRLLKYPYGNARARAMAAGLQGEEIRALALSAQEAERPWAAEEEEGGAEWRLWAEYQDFGRRIAHSLPRAGRELVLAYLDRSAVENLKVICRAVLQGKRKKRASMLLPGAGRTRPLAEFTEAESWEELAQRLPRSPFRDTLRQALRSSAETRLFTLETNLDRLFWLQVQSRVDRLSPLDRRAAGEILGRRADLDRYFLVVRGWQGGISPERILAGLPPMGTLFPSRCVREALRAEDAASALTRLLGESGVDDPLAPAGEVRLWRRLHRFLRRSLREAPFDISPPLCAVLLKELEIRDRRGIAGGRRAGAEKEVLLGALIAGG